VSSYFQKLKKRGGKSPPSLQSLWLFRSPPLRAHKQAPRQAVKMGKIVKAWRTENADKTKKSAKALA